MLAFPIPNDVKNAEDLVNEFKPMALEYKKQYPNYVLLNNTKKKKILAMFILDCLQEHVGIDDSATLKNLRDNFKQDSYIIANALSIVFVEYFGLPKDITLSAIKNFVNLALSFLIYDIIISLGSNSVISETKFLLLKSFLESKTKPNIELPQDVRSLLNIFFTDNEI